MRYIVPKIFCALGTIIILVGIFLSVVNITLGNMPISAGIAVSITAVLLGFIILAYNMKKTDNMRKLHIFKTIEVISVILFFVIGLASLLIFNHCIMVRQSAGEIKKNMNIRQLENMLPEYEKYANQRIENYKTQLNEAIQYKDYRQSELTNLGFDLNSIEDLNSQRDRKIQKSRQVLYPYNYDSLKISITDTISKFVNVVEGFSPITMPKNITRIEEWAKYWEKQLVDFSHYKMKGENSENFRYETTFGNVKNILITYDDYFTPKRFLGYGIGLFALICMLFPYFKVRRSNKLNY